MAVPPTIPTSFLPHAGSAEMHRSSSDFGGAFSFFAYFVLGLATVSAIVVFGYDQFLAGQRKAKDAELAAASAGIDSGTVTEVVRLRDRLASSETLLDKHVAFSNAFTFLEEKLPKTVRLQDVNFTLDADGKAIFLATGVAKTFNALAAASDAIANDGRLKDAIFYGIVVSKDNTVNFSLSATLDSKLITFTPPTPVLQTATTTP